MRFKKAFKIDVYLTYNMLYGFYHDVSHCSCKSFVLKVVSVVMSAVLLWKVIEIKEVFNGSINMITRVSEYMIYVICALITGNNYIINYYKAYVFEDKKIYQEVHKMIVVYTVLLHILYFMVFSLNFFTNIDESITWSSDFFLCIFRLGTELGRMPVIMILFLYHYRLKFLCSKIRDDAIQFTTTFQWKKYGNIYIKHIETLENTDCPVKFMILVHVLFGFIRVCTLQFNIVMIYKSNATNVITTIYLIKKIIQLIFIYAALFLPSVIMELTLKEMDILKTQLADEMISFTDERRKTQLSKMLNCFRTHPLRYTIWRSLEVNASLPLGFLSLCTTCLICLLQFHHMLGK